VRVPEVTREQIGSETSLCNFRARKKKEKVWGRTAISKRRGQRSSTKKKIKSPYDARLTLYNLRNGGATACECAVKRKKKAAKVQTMNTRPSKACGRRHMGSHRFY